LMYNIVVCVNVIEQCSRYMGSMHASHGGGRAKGRSMNRVDNMQNIQHGSLMK